MKRENVRQYLKEKNSEKKSRFYGRAKRQIHLDSFELNGMSTGNQRMEVVYYTIQFFIDTKAPYPLGISDRKLAN